MSEVVAESWLYLVLALIVGLVVEIEGVGPVERNHRQLVSFETAPSDLKEISQSRSVRH